MTIKFKYFAASLFYDAALKKSEFRVIELVDVTSEVSTEMAEEEMLRYAKDFNLSYCGVVNVFEAGDDMHEAYGEVFSICWNSDPFLERRLKQVLSEC